MRNNVKYVSFYRYWHKEDKECSWLLEVKEESREWTFYLIQAIEGLFGMVCNFITLPSLSLKYVSMSV